MVARAAQWRAPQAKDGPPVVDERDQLIYEWRKAALEALAVAKEANRQLNFAVDLVDELERQYLDMKLGASRMETALNAKG